MTTATRSKAVYAAFVYHDTEFNAAEVEHFLGYYPSLQSATDAVNAERGDYWQTGGVTYGFVFPPVFGKSPERWEEDEREPSWFVGTDGKADR